MKKSSLIIFLAVLQCACVAPGGAPYRPASLLSFETIGREIAVHHESTDEADDLDQAVAFYPQGVNP